MKLILFIPAVGLLCSGAMRFSEPASPKLPSQPTITPVTTTSPEQPKMWAGQKDLYYGEDLDLFFQAPNPGFLGVIDPDGKFFYLVFPKETAVGNLKPVVDSETFRNLESLHFSTLTLKADPYTYGVMDNQQVFTKSGTYRFVMGDNLHVDDTADIEVVQVRYKHTSRPKEPFKG